MNMREALERIAKYPVTRGDDLSIESARQIAREALAAQAQQESKPVGYISAKTVEWLNGIGEMVDSKMELTFRTEPSLEPYTVPFYLQSQAHQPEYTFDQLAKLLMQAATKEGHKVTMKIKWAQSPAPDGDKK